MAGECGGAGGGGGGAGEFMLFGVRVVVDPMRKSVSLNNLSQYEQLQEALLNTANHNSTDGKGSGRGNNSNNPKEDSSSAAATVAAGYASADDAVHHSTGSRGERKRGVPWTEEEHKLFLLGLQRVGKGDWRGISRNFVKTRTPTQVASHAQKYFLRRRNLNRRRRRSSLFDITTDTVMAAPMEEEHGHQQEHETSKDASLPSPLPPSLPESGNINNFHVVPAFPITTDPAMLPVPTESPVESLTQGQGSQAIKPAASLIRPIPVLPDSHTSAMSDLDLNLTSTIRPSSLSLGLSLTLDQREPSSRHSAFEAMPSFSNGDSIISVACGK